jgi:SEC-C motif
MWLFNTNKKITTKELWKLYTSKDAVIKHFDQIYDFFSQELPSDFIEEYDVGEVIIETKGHNETAKNFDRVLKFIELIQVKHPDLYLENFQYLDDFLIDYHSFHHDRSAAVKAFSNFMEYPDQSYDELLASLKKLIYYQHTDIVDRFVTQSYLTIKYSDKLIGGCEYDLALYKFFINLEYFYKLGESKSLDKITFNSSMIPYEFNFKTNGLDNVEKGLLRIGIDSETLTKNFITNRKDYMLTVQSLFHVEMLKKDFPFLLSGILWDKLIEYWEEQSNQKNQKPDAYFSVELKSFEKFISQLGGSFFSDNTAEMIAVLWASVYAYDFLLSIDLISQDIYDRFISASRVLKGSVIANFTSELWNMNFVHYWKKPDSISDAEFQAETKIFEKSFFIKAGKFTKAKKEIQAELNNIGELSDHILLAGDERDNHKIDNSLFEGLLENFNMKSIGQNNLESQPTIVPVRTEPKIGRNDPCSCGSGQKYKKCCGK